MSDVDRLLREFIDRYRSGGPADPRDLLDRAEGGDRAELEALIDAFLARAPRREFDPAAFPRSGAAEVVEGLHRSLSGSAGLWPSLLPRLRDAAQVRRADLVARLSRALGVSGREEKVGAYYHSMEQGSLPASGVSDRVLEALGEIVGQSAEALRRAGEGVGPGGPGGGEAPGAAAFARTGVPDPAYGDVEAPASPGTTADRTADAGEWDEVDRLFRGG